MGGKYAIMAYVADDARQACVADGYAEFLLASALATAGGHMTGNPHVEWTQMGEGHPLLGRELSVWGHLRVVGWYVRNAAGMAVRGQRPGRLRFPDRFPAPGDWLVRAWCATVEDPPGGGG